MGAAIGSAILNVLADMEKLYEGRAREDDVAHVVDRSIATREAMTRRLCRAFESYLREKVIGNLVTEQRRTLTVMTLSASSTIRESIIHSLKSDCCNSEVPFEILDLRILESRPLYEGVSLASTILSSVQSVDDDIRRPKVSVSLYTDGSAALAARDIDVLLIGADRIAGHDGAVSNKTGSLPAILAAKHISPQARILVISELDKVAQADSIESCPEEDNDAEEVLGAWSLGRPASP